MKRYLLTSAILLVCGLLPAQQNTFFGNQVGFKPKHPKTMVVSEGITKFSVIEKQSGQSVFIGTTSRSKLYPFADQKVRIADFSNLKKEGLYYLQFENQKSHDFYIDQEAYSDVLKASLKSYYLTRASMPIEAPFGNPYTRTAGHSDTIVYIHPSAADELRKTDDIISSPGGWYDAGDYNKYMVNSGISTFTLLRTYENFTNEHLGLYLHIPESDNAKADLMDEIEYNIQWMLTMQDPNDGGVYHKLTNKKFSEFIAPSACTAKRYVVQKTVTATLNFAATIAYYARLTTELDQKEALIKKATQAYQWALANPNTLYTQPDDIKTGQYGDEDASDELFWATSELYLSTREAQYANTLDQSDFSLKGVPTWQNVKSLGMISLAHRRSDYQEEATQSILNLADKLVYYSKTNAYGNTQGMNGDADFNWGSNSNLGNQALLMIEAFLKSRDKKYIAPIFANIYYLLGQNATQYCFVTGFGSKSPQNIHHRPSATDLVPGPYPGLLAGGPNKDQQDIKEVKDYPSKLPALSYIDHQDSYASNETAINWNAPLVYVLTFAYSYK